MVYDRVEDAGFCLQLAKIERVANITGIGHVIGLATRFEHEQRGRLIAAAVGAGWRGVVVARIYQPAAAEAIG